MIADITTVFYPQARLKGIRCGRKPTSCPDQLALALEKAKESV